MDDKTGISWSDPGWPYGDLNRSTALLYFELSPFFDANSNNADARSRGLDPANEHVLRTLPVERPEYVVAEAQEPHLFVIRRQARQRDGSMQHQAYYYILYMTIYQAPTLHSVVTSRLRRCMFSIRQGLERVRRDLAPLPKLLLEQERKASLQAEGSAGEAAAQAVAAVAEAQPIAVAEVLSSEEQDYWERSDNIIMRTLQRYPMPQLPGVPASQQPQPQQEEAFKSTAPKAEPEQAAASAAAADAPSAAVAGTSAGAATGPVPAGKAKRAGGAGKTAANATAGPAAQAGPSNGAAPGRAGTPAPTVSQTESAAATGETSSAQQGTTASGSTAAAGSRAGAIKVRLKVKPLSSQTATAAPAAATAAAAAQGSQGQPPPAGGEPSAKRARR